jgi:hypothetical protein
VQSEVGGQCACFLPKGITGGRPYYERALAIYEHVDMLLAFCIALNIKTGEEKSLKILVEGMR